MVPKNPDISGLYPETYSEQLFPTTLHLQTLNLDTLLLKAHKLQSTSIQQEAWSPQRLNYGLN